MNVFEKITIFYQIVSNTIDYIIIAYYSILYFILYYKPITYYHIHYVQSISKHIIESTKSRVNIIFCNFTVEKKNNL